MSEQENQPRYVETRFEPGDAFRFVEPTDSALAALHELAARMPVRPFFRDPDGIDSLETLDIAGDLDAVLARLKEILRKDHEENEATMSGICNFETFVTDADFRRDALHVVTRLSPRDGKAASVMYGARLQRVDGEQYFLWSDY